MKRISQIIAVALFLAGLREGFAQSSLIMPIQNFVNLDFEKANLSGFSPGVVPQTNSFPNWPANSGTLYTYNDVPADSTAAVIVGTSFGIPAIQGNYSAYLEGGSQADPDTNGASISQFGLIPAAAQYITYWGDALQVKFANQLLAFSAVGSGPGYTIWQANISAFAGQTSVLTFTAPWQTSGLLDNIQFSATAVPEPGALGLSALGGLFLAWRRWKQKAY